MTPIDLINLPFTIMTPLMIIAISDGSESLFTELASIWFFTCMNSHVYNQVTTFIKQLITNVTYKITLFFVSFGQSLFAPSFRKAVFRKLNY